MESEINSVWVRKDSNDVIIVFGPVKTYVLERNGVSEVLSKTHLWVEDSEGLFVTQRCVLEDRYKKIGEF